MQYHFITFFPHREWFCAPPPIFVIFYDNPLYFAVAALQFALILWVARGIIFL